MNQQTTVQNMNFCRSTPLYIEPTGLEACDVGVSESTKVHILDLFMAPTKETDMTGHHIPLTHYIEAAVELADSVPGSSLAHLADLQPLVEVRIKPLHAGERRHAVIPSNSIHVTLTGCRQKSCRFPPQLTVRFKY